jgi:hypothetical protein
MIIGFIMRQMSEPNAYFQRNTILSCGQTHLADLLRGFSPGGFSTISN